MNYSPLTLGISPCPNDTFIFEAWITGALSTTSDVIPSPLTTFLDVQNLNEAAQRAEFDVVKVSCGNLPYLKKEYEILSCGGAMGFGCGPLLLSSSQSPFDPTVETWLPGKNTTAALLFHHWAPSSARIRYALFDEVYRALLRGEAMQGVVIHEHRFTFARDGLNGLLDLGGFWEESMHSPIPLGVIVARKTLGPQRIQEIEQAIQSSLHSAWYRKDLITPFIREHAQDTDPLVMEQHIRMFVNDFTRDIGPQGRLALERLNALAKLNESL